MCIRDRSTGILKTAMGFLCLLAIFVLPASSQSSTDGLDIEWLANRTSSIIQGCKETILPSGHQRLGNATVAFTPDATHSYGAQWTRDFQYTVAGASALMDELTVKASVRYTFAGMRADGCMPDRVQTDGMSVMAPGMMQPGNRPNPDHDHAWDNGPFAALLLAATVRAWPDKEFFCELEPSARKALDFVNRSSNGLVYNDPIRPNCTYGFTDTVAKTGHLLFCSLLYVDASRQMAALSSLYSCGDAVEYAAEATQVGDAIDSMSDPNGPLWLAATIDNSYPDVWGSAYIVALNLSTPAKQAAAMNEMVQFKSRYFSAGQVRSLPMPLLWTKCNFTYGGTGLCAPNGTYQNGAYWATPLTYMTAAMINTGNVGFAETLLEECISDFKQNGIYEDVDYGLPAVSKGVLNYTASAANVLQAAKLLQAFKRGECANTWP
eukprot:TRINITY_DN32869_c0_g1_i1.p1 TRINITY_DN32869_c0_g1~~TRINITY_DN32869_c0_g1_i1.p1  ORF type:complete len:436 (-),score=61.60 TRINITY_DN32869_c0_g1_i1:175-1482(-)